MNDGMLDDLALQQVMSFFFCATFFSFSRRNNCFSFTACQRDADEMLLFSICNWINFMMQAIQLSIREVQRPHQMQEQVQDQEQQRRQPPPPTEPSHQQQFHLPASGGRSRGVTSTPLQQNDSGDDHDDDDNQDEELQIALRLSMSDAGQQ
jgi:hypothetical protein